MNKPLTTDKKKKGKSLKTAAVVGLGLNAVNKASKNKFNSNELTEFAKKKTDSTIIGRFPNTDSMTNADTSDTKNTKKKKQSTIDAAKDVVKNKDKMPTKKQ